MIPNKLKKATMTETPRKNSKHCIVFNSQLKDKFQKCKSTQESVSLTNQTPHL